MRRILIVVALSVVSSAVIFAADHPATQPQAPDLSTPKAAVISFFEAVQRQDAAAAKECAVRNDTIDKYIDAIVAEGKAKQDYLDAAKKRFGPDAVKRPDFTPFLIEMVKRSKVQEHGDTADIGDHGDFPCRKEKGNWKFDLPRQNPDAARLDETIRYLTDSASAYIKFTPQVPGGSWKSFEEMDQARSAAAPAPPPPPPPPSSQQN